MSEIEEREIWIRFKQGDRESFSYIIHQYYDLLFKYGLSIYADESFVKDNLQDLFLSIWQNREKLTEVETIKFYLLKSFRRLLLKGISQERKQAHLSQTENLSQVASTPSEEKLIIDEEATQAMQAQLKKAIDNLPARQKEAIHLKFFQNLSYAQIATIMEISYPSLRNLVSQAIKSLRKQYR